MNASSDAATQTRAFLPRQIFRVSLAARLASLFGTLVLALGTAFMVGAAALAGQQQWPLGLLMTPFALIMAALTLYVAHDLAGKWGLRVVLDSDSVTLDLPAWRSLIHRPPAQHLTIPYARIEAIEARFEAYGSLGMEMMQRAYVLRQKDGEIIFLFEERALATAMESTTFAKLVKDLAARAGVAVHELGTAEGRGGVLGAWGTHAPDWAAPRLPAARARLLWARAAATGAAAIVTSAAATNGWYGGLLRRGRRTPPPEL